MTLHDVLARVADIRSHAYDDEVAHGMEDDLRADVLRAIAAGEANGPELAAAALRTDAIAFARWCA